MVACNITIKCIDVCYVAILNFIDSLSHFYFDDTLVVGEVHYHEGGADLILNCCVIESNFDY